MTPPPLGPGAPPAYQGHHRSSRGTTELPRDTTFLSGPPQACQEHHRPSRGTNQRHHGSVRGTTVLPGAPTVQRGTTSLKKSEKRNILKKGTTEIKRPKSVTVIHDSPLRVFFWIRPWLRRLEILGFFQPSLFLLSLAFQRTAVFHFRGLVWGYSYTHYPYGWGRKWE